MTDRTRPGSRAWLAPLAAALLVVLALSGCDRLGSTGGKGYADVADGIVQIKPADRGSAVDISGTSLKGATIDLAKLRGGRPVVVNVWGSWCDPCIAEAPKLAQAAREVKATFVGIDIRDQTASALAFNRSFGISYQSIADPSSSTLPAFGRYDPSSPPTTYVLDSEGRVAAVLSGSLPSVTTLSDIVQQTAAGQ